MRSELINRSVHYKSLCVVITIFATMVNTQTHTQTASDQLY